MQHEKVIVIDFGGQYNQLGARRVRECAVYCEIYSYRTPLEEILAMKPKGIILTGGPNSVYEEGAASCSRELFGTGVPVLGLCYGAQLMMHVLGGKVARAEEREYGKTETHFNTSSELFKGIPETSTVWMSHFDTIFETAEGFSSIAYTKSTPVAAAENTAEKLYAIQFHPEVLHTRYGAKILYNFVRGICGCAGDWEMVSFIDEQVARIRERVGEGKVLLGLSGGVDSSVAAVLMSKAVGKQLTCVFVDHGLLRKNEGDEVEAVFGPEGPYELQFVRVNAADRFYEKLSGVEEPERKRKIIGEEFIRVFEAEARKIGRVDFLVQGTIYPDVVESGMGGESAVIKSHHNVGGLPDYVDFKEIIEPLRSLFKDEVRKVGQELGIPDHLVFRQPFPGPGLGIRIIGEVTAAKVRMVQDADAIYREEVGRAIQEWRKNAGCVEQAIPVMKESVEKGVLTQKEYDAAMQEGQSAVYKRLTEIGGENPPWMPDQYFAALTNMRSVGVMGDERTYDYAIALRAVQTVDFRTAESASLTWELLQTVTSRIVNEVRGVNRVFYDLT
ncbi:MAG: glutamine-hydrolyzing GMP synthase, partial [Lachnospiraceae bacterium]|nr:glutamine-hydrolyzing GMP synthase [Lachnospiraceae bacterium]